MRAFFDFDPNSPKFSITEIVKNEFLMELITIRAPLNNHRLAPENFDRLFPVWNCLYSQQNVIFMALFNEIGEKVIERISVERVNPKMKECFLHFLQLFKSVLLSEGTAVVNKWAKYKLFAARQLKNKKHVLLMVNQC